MMRIAQVATLLSPDGAYGGPVRVALNQLRQLQDMGHQVCLYATYRGYDEAPTEMNGVPVRAFKARQIVPKIGFAGLTSPALLRQLRRELPTFDVAHVHLARDLVTLPSANLAIQAGVPLIAQTHGMIDRSSHPLAGAIDALLTKRVLRSASRVLFLTDHEERDLREVGGSVLRFAHLVNGVPVTSGHSIAPTRDQEVLFLARLEARKRPQHFALAAAQLAHEFPGATFTLIGPDEGELSDVRKIIEKSGTPDRIRWEGPLDLSRTLARMAKASVYVLPSVNEPFPMSVLEAASLGLPVVITKHCGLASAVLAHKAGLVVDTSLPSLAAALRELLEDEELRGEMGRNSKQMAETEFSLPAVVDRLDLIYLEAVCGKKPASGNLP